VQLEVADILGNKVAVLADKVQQRSSYRVSFDALSLPQGDYFYSLKL
jgi:hypothetical protein